MSASVSRSLLCLLALGGVAALQVRPESSRLAAPRPVLRATTLVAAAAAAEDEGKAGLSASTANLVKSIVGSGVLSLPVGVAAFSSARTAILPALTLLAVAGAISGYCKRHTVTSIACCTARTPARTQHHTAQPVDGARSTCSAGRGRRVELRGNGDSLTLRAHLHPHLLNSSAIHSSWGGI